MTIIELYPDVPAEVVARWRPGERCLVLGDGDRVFVLSEDMDERSVLLITLDGLVHGRESYEKLLPADGWSFCVLGRETHRARLKTEVLWRVEAEHLTPGGWREVKDPDTLIALHRQLTEEVTSPHGRALDVIRAACRPLITAELLSVPEPASEPVVQVEAESYRVVGECAETWLASLGLHGLWCGKQGGTATYQLGDVEVACDEDTLSTGLVVLAATCLEGLACPPEVCALSLRALVSELVQVWRSRGDRAR